MTKDNQELIDSIQTELLTGIMRSENVLEICKSVYYLESARNGGISVNKMNWGEVKETTVTDGSSLSIYNTKEENDNGNN